MNIKAIRSDDIYRKMMSTPNEEKENIYRYELMKPFEFKWQCIGIPLKAEAVGGYDVVSATGMGGGEPICMPYCGGYACGYALIQHYLKKTGKSIYQATITPTMDILKETEDFWN